MAHRLLAGVVIAMPIYEYECKKCGHRFDVMQSFSDPPIKTCGNNGCRGRVRKVLSPPAIIFKGSGFYVTDYGRNGKRTATTKTDATEKAEKIKETVESTTSPSTDAKSDSSKKD
jgi:putative FmdB family regulatory protein